MDYRTLDTLRHSHPAWRLLTAEHAPLIASFLYASFIKPNKRTLPKQELVSQLDDYLHHLRERAGEGAYPKRPEQYLDDWASDDHGWLRKFYPATEDQPHFDITPATEKAIEWLSSLAERQFVGTESRLLTVFTLLREIAEGTEPSPFVRISELERRRSQIDEDIQRLRTGRMAFMDPTGVKDRFLQMAQTARTLLSDFREVEQKFRELDRGARERIALWAGNKAELLEEIFGQRDAIADSDQGKSFRAFWEFLMSNARQEEFSSLLRAVFALEPVKELGPNPGLLRIHYDWLEAGEVAQRTIARLSQQLRRYVDDQVVVENRRIMEIIRQIEQHALEVRDEPPVGSLMEVDDSTPDLDLIMDRPLFSPPFKPTIGDQVVAQGDQEFSADALYEQVYVDRSVLDAHIRWALQTRSQVSVEELIQYRPLEHGLAEIVAYMSIAAEMPGSVIDDAVKQTIHWSDEQGVQRQATLPLVIFSRRLATVGADTGVAIE
jgi:flagellar motility protein MotE (MotC chaperone)